MLDTRGLRDRQAPARDAVGANAPGRTLLGADQEAWLFNSLRRSQQAGTAWRLLGQQILFAPLTPTGTAPQNVDVWDGYPAARARVFDFLEQREDLEPGRPDRRHPQLVGDGRAAQSVPRLHRHAPAPGRWRWSW